MAVALSHGGGGRGLGAHQGSLTEAFLEELEEDLRGPEGRGVGMAHKGSFPLAQLLSSPPL